MKSTHSVTKYLDGLKHGDEEAAQRIWERYLSSLIQLANKKLRSAPRKFADEEDVVQIAFAQFFQQVQQGRFPKLNDRNDLWQVLAMLVDRRAIDQIRKQTSQKAGGGKVHNESVLMSADESADQQGIANLADVNPTPELAYELAEIFRERLESLDDESYRQIALLKLKGYTNREIVSMLPDSLRTIERKLKNIRDSWSSD